MRDHQGPISTGKSSHFVQYLNIIPWNLMGLHKLTTVIAINHIQTLLRWVQIVDNSLTKAIWMIYNHPKPATALHVAPSWFQTIMRIQIHVQTVGAKEASDQRPIRRWHVASGGNETWQPIRCRLSDDVGCFCRCHWTRRRRGRQSCQNGHSECPGFFTWLKA